MSDETHLHPAADVFRDVVLREISAENRALRDEVARLQPLLDYAQTVEVVGIVTDDASVAPHSPERADGPSDGANGAPAPATTVEVVATAQLGHGAVRVDDDGTRTLHVPIAATRKLLLKHNLRCDFRAHDARGIGARLAGKNLGTFPTEHVRLSAHVEVTDGDEVVVFFGITNELTIYGVVTDLSNEELVRFKQDPRNHLAGYIRTGFERDNGHDDRMSAAFTPTCLVLTVTSALGDTLEAIGRATAGAAAPGPTSPADELRRATMAAFGGDEHEEARRENARLKSQRDALRSVRGQTMRVDLEHSAGTLRFALDETEPLREEGGGVLYRYVVPDGTEGSAMAVSDIKLSSFLLSGTKLNLGDMFFLRRFRFEDIILGDDQRIDGLRIPYAPGIEARGRFNFGDLSQGVIEDIVPRFGQRIIASLSSVWGPQFPPEFKLYLTEIRFGQDLVEHILKLDRTD